MNTNEAAQAACKRLTQTLNRSAGQHSRHTERARDGEIVDLDAAHVRAVQGARDALRAAVAQLERRA